MSVATSLAQGAWKLKTILDEVRIACLIHSTVRCKLKVMTPKISKNEKDIYKLASELIDQIDDLEQLRKERVSDAIPELDKSLAKLEEYVQYRKLGNLI